MTNFEMRPAKLSVIVATRDRAYAIRLCLDAVAAAFTKAAPLDAEIIVVDNGSQDDTAATVTQWAAACPFPVRLLREPQAGLSRAHNLAIGMAQGELLAFTDDDCRLHPEYVNDLLRHAASDAAPVLRGGRIELGDPGDLPLTIKTTPEPIRWDRRLNSARRRPIAGELNGCNMVIPRRIVETVGAFDLRFGPGGIIGSGGDSDYFFRTYLAGFALEYVPDMAVVHWHGRKTPDVGRELLRRYMTANGALAAKYVFADPDLARPFYWDVKNAIREVLTGSNTFLPAIGFSHRDKVVCAVKGAVRYALQCRRDRVGAPRSGAQQGAAVGT